ncbi:MAG TPA: MYG1 family protein [Candidatus Paceibacterota bacterium]
MTQIIVTHDSSYHADDVFAVAVLLLKLGDAKVMRSRKQEVIEAADYIVDTGFIYNPKKNRFDHHQPSGAGYHSNGIPMSSFGLVWKEFGAILAGGEREAALIEKQLVIPQDAHDNGIAIADYKFDGIREYTVRDLFWSYVKHGKETEENLYKVFMDVAEVAKEILAREIKKAQETIKSGDTVMKIYNESSDKRLIILPEELAWRDVLTSTKDALFAIYPRNDGFWSAKAVPESFQSYAPRKPFPESWGGLSGEALIRISGVSDAIFCHKGLFMAAAKSKEGVIALAQKALER